MVKILTKLFIKDQFSIKRLMGFETKKEKVKTVLIGLAIAYAAITFFGLFGYMFFDLGKTLSQMGQIELMLSFLAVYAVGLTLILVLFRAQGYLFHYRDYEILAPLPISSRTLLLSKTIVMMLLLYVSSFLFTIPIGVSYFYHSGLDGLKIAIYLISFLFFPLIPVVFMSLISLGITSITSRFKHNKVLNILFLFAIFIGFMLASFSFSDADINPLTGQIELFKRFQTVYPPIKWMIEAIDQKNLLSLFLLVGSNTLVFGGFIYGIQGFVNQANQRGNKQNVSWNTKKLSYHERPLIWMMIIKEWKKFIGVPIYAVNAGFGAVILLVASIGSLFYQEGLKDILGQMVGVGLAIEPMLLVLIAFCLAMAYTPAISLSLEGKNLWVIKSLPIEPKQVMTSKILFNMLLVIPAGIVSVLLFGISFQLPWMNQVIILLLVVSFSTLISYFNGVINLLVPRFDFKNEVEIVKQSMGALFGVFGGFFWISLLGVLYYFLSKTLATTWVLFILFALSLLLIIPFYWIIEKKSAQFFNKY